MISQKILSKSIILGFFIFLLFNTSSLGFYQENLKHSVFQDEPVPHVFGIFGANGWYITAVTVSFEYDPNVVQEIQYYLNNKWNVYNSPFNVNKDGEYKIPWFWVDKKGNTHSLTMPISFKIDQSPPTIKLTKKSAGKNKVVFTANAVDTVSQIEQVEFYLDDVLQETLYQPPYQYNWTGEDQHWVYAIGYNFAGLSEKSNNVSTPRLQIRSHNLLCVIFNFLQKIFLRI